MRFALIAVLLASCAAVAQNPAPSPAPAAPADPTAHLRERADHAPKQDCAKVCFETAAHLAEASNQEFTNGNVERGQQWMKDAVEYARKGTEASIETRKHQKDAEIALRKLSRRIHDIGDSLALEDRKPVYDDSRAIDDLRDKMLTSMFGTPKKSLGAHQ